MKNAPLQSGLKKSFIFLLPDEQPRSKDIENWLFAHRNPVSSQPPVMDLLADCGFSRIWEKVHDGDSVSTPARGNEVIGGVWRVVGRGRRLITESLMTAG